MKYMYYKLSGLIILAAIIVSFLYWNAERPYQTGNGFNRKIVQLTKYKPYVALMPVANKGIIDDGEGICYFYEKDPTKIWRLNLMTMKFDQLAVHWKHKKLASEQFKLMADQKHLYINYVKQKEVLSFDLSTSHVQSYKLMQFPYRLLRTEIGKLVINCLDTNKKQPFLLKQDLIGNLKGTEIYPWPNEDKGIIPIDGELHFDPSTNLISYHYFYKNGFILLDTNLKLLSTIKTIDTILHSKVSVKELNGSFTLGAPPKIVSGHASADAGKLYIHGYLKADNETVKNFRNHTVIDVYDTIKGTYVNSFYIPAFDGKKMNGFNVSKGRLICLYEAYVVIYTI